MLEFINARTNEIEKELTPLLESKGADIQIVRSFMTRVTKADCEARDPLLREGIPEFIKQDGPGGVNSRTKERLQNTTRNQLLVDQEARKA